MSRRAAVHLVVVLLALVGLGFACDLAFFGRPDETGPFPVGRTTFLVVDPDRADRTLPVDVWYPAVDDGSPVSVYDLVVTGLPSELALDNPPVADGTFPLLVFSHGSNGIRFQSIFLQEHLASHGFIVAAPDHVGNTASDAFLPMPPPFETRDRPLDVSLVIDRMLERAVDATDAFFMAIDPFKIGVLGHSFGGFTALAMISGFDDVPRDPRISAIMPISPGTSLSDEELARVDVTTLVLGGTSDTVTPVDPNSVRAYEETSGRPRWRIDVDKAGHNSFTEICLLFDVLLDAGLPPELLELLLGNVEQGCAPELIPIEEAQRITKLYATSFFHAKLAGRNGYIPFLTRGRVKKEDLPVFYFRTGGLGQ